jgi:HlyD family secretion protein
LDDLPHQAEVERAAADLKLAQAERTRAQAQLELKAQEVERAQAVKSNLSQSEFDQAVADHRIAQAELEIAEARVEQAKIALKQAEITLGYTTIKSPIDGVVIDRRVNVGQTVVAGLNAPSLFLLARDLSRMQVWAAVNEADIGNIYKGQPVTFKVDAYRDETFSGEVSQIRLNATTAHNVVTYGVVVDIQNTNGKLLPFMTANLQFEVNRRKDALLVANQALRWTPDLNDISPEFRAVYDASSQAEDGSEAERSNNEVNPELPTLWVVHSDGLLKPIEVEVGLTDGVSTEIVTDALSTGDPVAVAKLQEKRQDFVSSFVSRVTETPTE